MGVKPRLGLTPVMQSKGVTEGDIQAPLKAVCLVGLPADRFLFTCQVPGSSLGVQFFKSLPHCDSEGHLVSGKRMGALQQQGTGGCLLQSCGLGVWAGEGTQSAQVSYRGARKTSSHAISVDALGSHR